MKLHVIALMLVRYAVIFGFMFFLLQPINNHIDNYFVVKLVEAEVSPIESVFIIKYGKSPAVAEAGKEEE